MIWDQILCFRNYKQYTLVSVGLTWEYVLIEFGLQLLILEYLEGYCIYMFKVNYI